MINAIIQARMGSTRLPGKTMKIIGGKPLIWQVVRRVNRAKKIDKVIVATTNNPEDDVIEELAKKEKWLFYRGSAENVLERYYQAAKKFNSKIIVRITSDCPLIEPKIIDKCIELFVKNKVAYLSNIVGGKTTFPLGLAVEVFTFNALKKAYQNATEDYEKEHVTPYIYENKKNKFRIGKPLKAFSFYARNYRLTVDYPEDLLMVEKIYNALYRPKSIIDFRKTIYFLDKNPDIVSININCQQKNIKNQL